MDTMRILGTGSYLPPKVLSNDDLVAMGLDTSDEWITKRTGVRERRMADPGVATSDLGYEASARALEASGLTPTDIDLILVARSHRIPVVRLQPTGSRPDWMHPRPSPSISPPLARVLSLP